MKHRNGTSLLLRLLLSFLLVFAFLGTLLCSIGTAIVASPSLFCYELEQQDAAKKVSNSLSTKFETQYNTTAVPASVYMDVLTVDFLDHAMTTWIEDAYDAPDVTPTVNTEALTNSINAYFAQYAEENDYTIDDAYTEKLTEVIENAEQTVTSAIDVYHISMMQDAGIWAKLFHHTTLLYTAMIGCGIITLLLLIGLLLLRKHSAYWIGTSFFASGIILTIGSGSILASGLIAQFALKEAATYAVVTGLMYMLTYLVLGVGIIAVLFGLALLLRNIINEKKATTSNVFKTDVTETDTTENDVTNVDTAEQDKTNESPKSEKA